MAETAKQETTVKTKVAKVRSVVGLLIDPYSHIRFDGEVKEKVEITPWVQAQIDANKIEIVE